MHEAQAASSTSTSHEEGAQPDPDKWTLVSRLSSSLAQSVRQPRPGEQLGPQHSQQPGAGRAAAGGRG